MLMKSIAQAISTYIIRLFELPKGVVHDLTHILAKFLVGKFE